MNKIVGKLRWITGFIVFFILMSYVSKEAFEKKFNNERRNFVESLIVSVSGVPSTLKSWYESNFKRPPLSIDITNHMGENLFEIGKIPEQMNVLDSLYILYYQYHGEDKGTVYLKNVKNGSLAHSWDIPLKTVLEDLTNIDRELIGKYKEESLPVNLTMKVAKNFNSIGISQSLIVENQSLVFHCGGLGYMYKIDRDSNLLWKSKRLTHHSIASDRNDNIWTCSIDLENETANKLNYREDAIVSYDLNGKELYFIPLTELFVKNDLFNKLIASTPNYNNDKYGLDPYHLNDVLPVLENGKIWDQDDVFVSLRTQSMVMHFRPQNDSIIWYEKGPWFGQHDVDIKNDSTISVFNNNIWFFNNKYLPSGRTSNIASYDFSSKKVTMSYTGEFASAYEGRQTRLSSGELIVEATEKGIYYYFDDKERLVARFYSPFGSDKKKAMRPRWSRFYVRSGEDFLLQILFYGKLP